MSEAHVTRLDALLDLKAALATFAEDARAALSSAEGEVRRVVDRLQRELPYQWEKRLLQARDELAQANSNMSRKRLQRTDGYAPDTTEEDKAIKTAKRNIVTAEKKIELTLRWRRAIEEAWNQYQGSAGRLDDAVSGTPPRSVAELNRAIRALEQYLSIEVPLVAASAPEAAAPATSMARPEDAVDASHAAPTPTEKKSAGDADAGRNSV
jgi:hypothetical protein